MKSSRWANCCFPQTTKTNWAQQLLPLISVDCLLGSLVMNWSPSIWRLQKMLWRATSTTYVRITRMKLFCRKLSLNWNSPENSFSAKSCFSFLKQLSFYRNFERCPNRTFRQPYVVKWRMTLGFCLFSNFYVGDFKSFWSHRFPNVLRMFKRFLREQSGASLWLFKSSNQFELFLLH